MLTENEINNIYLVKNKKVQMFFKRIADIVLSLIGIIILSPIFLIIIISIKFNSKGTSIFKQTRVGFNGENFTIYKFRTMIINADSKRKLEIDSLNLDNFVFQSKNDDRVTSVGSVLRKTSLDEIPQLLNVLLGNMTLVGPRPEIPEVVNFYTENYKLRLIVKPGITGLAQISGRGEIELGKTISYDLEYIRNFSLWFDFKILIKTFLKVFKNEGAF